MTPLIQIAPPAPRGSAEFRLFDSAVGRHLFMVDGSRVFDLDADTFAKVRQIVAAGSAGNERIRSILGFDAAPKQIGRAAPPPPLYSISLNIAQACNLRCGYCYADEGRFQGAPRMMDLKVAQKSVDALLSLSDPDLPVVLGFMGGEPLLNKSVLHAVTHYAASRAAALGRIVRFSITTNGTLVEQEDAELFRDFSFCVQVSMDGNASWQDSARPMQDGSGSYRRVRKSLELLEAVGRPRQLSARATIVPGAGPLMETLQHLVGLGFDDVGVAPVIVSPHAEMAFRDRDLARLLDEMIACGERALSEFLEGRMFPFSNFFVALQEIHRGTHRPHPCGAGAAYLSANAEGALYACHRFIDDSRYHMGDVSRGPDFGARSALLTSRHVDFQDPCRRCWARYLCGGGCYYEIENRGRVACDYIRGWLDFCLRAYVEAWDHLDALDRRFPAFSLPNTAPHWSEP